MDILDKRYVVEMPNGERWSVPVRLIAEHRAKHYAHEFDDDLAKSLIEDTGPLFDQDEYEIEDWARNNMNWDDVSSKAKMLATGETDYQEGWVNGDVEIQ